MILSLYKDQFINQLKKEYPIAEVKSFFYFLTEAYLGKNRLQIALDSEIKLDESQEQKFKTALKRLQRQEPIQYILGKACFYGLDFTVNSDVLIPRPETEELVSWVVEDLKIFSEKNAQKILDIGTGSGCIAISLAKNLPNTKISALDISKAALKIAKENALANKVKLQFLQTNILERKTLPENFDVLVSNPPYVRESEKTNMQRNVLENEPRSALYVSDADPLIFYRKIAELAKKERHKISVYLEINQYLASETQEVFEKKGFQTELRKDIFENNRMLKAVWP